jgi:hypothetical protein
MPGAPRLNCRISNFFVPPKVRRAPSQHLEAIHSQHGRSLEKEGYVDDIKVYTVIFTNKYTQAPLVQPKITLPERAQ